ncbi:MAG: hypothetical protein RIQ89_124 [Bacteroidota bacterium]|jgi:hypothetical protein
MKNLNHKIIILVLLPMLSFGQLKVRTNGTVKIGNGTPWPSGGNLEITGANQTLEARIFPSTANIARLWTINSIYGFGFGIDGNGIGQIYKNIHSPSSIMTFNSSGDFGIGRNPSYKLDVNGSIRANTTIYTSDSTLKDNISTLEDEGVKLFQLRGVTYQMKDLNTLSKEFETMNESKLIPTAPQDNTRKHYGFLAQEVRNIFPELVYEDSEGLLGIDYVAMIPLLVNELKILKTEVDDLSNFIKSNSLLANSIQYSSNSELSHLYQNYPNPFNSTTSIKFKISHSVKTANLRIYDLVGTQLKSFEITQRGDGSFSIKASEFNPGTYIYSLFLDGNLLASKQMILTDN